MNFVPLIFFVKETFIGIKRSSLMAAIAVATVTISLIILGVFMLISVNLNKITEDIVSKLDVRVFLKSNLDFEDIQLFKRKLTAIDGVKKVEFIDNKVAWKKFQSDYGHLKLKEYISDNPLPHSLNLKLEDFQNISQIILYLKRYETLIDDIVYGGELADRVAVVSRYMAISGWILIILLITSSLFIIVNTIRLTVIARQEEISIMRLVGATDLFIKCPFILEGFTIGIFGAAMAVLFLYFIYTMIISHLITIMPFFPFINNNSSLYYVYGFVIISGALIGMLGAYISVTRTLRVR